MKDEGNRGGLHRQLREATPADRATVILRFIADHPTGPLDLSPVDGCPVMLDDIDLGQEALAARYDRKNAPPRWWSGDGKGANLRGARLSDASLRRANLRGADLQGADLRGADLREAVLESANLQEADLAGARLDGAALAAANLQGAMMEDATCAGATMRFAVLLGATLEGADLRTADLWGATLDNALLIGANLQGATLREASLVNANLTGAELHGALLNHANLQGAILRGIDLRTSSMRDTNLRDATLREANLQGIDLTTCAVAHIQVSGAWLEKTRLDQDQLGGAIGEELARDYAAAGKGYLALEHNFAGIGDPDAVSWAYRKKRRMQKLAAREQAHAARRERRWVSACSRYGKYATDQMVEWLCDYGESAGRVLACMLLVYLLFMGIYAVTGDVVHVTETATGLVRESTRKPLDLAVFSLLAMTTSGSPVVGLLPRSESVHLLTGTQALMGIFLTGLLGFVVGNRIRR